MNKSFLKNPLYLVIVILAISSILIVVLYSIIKYEKHIEKDMFTIATSDILSITKNKAKHIQSFLKHSDNYIEDIKKDENLQKRIEENIKDLLTNNIKYAYLIYKDKKGVFRFLVDASSADDKAMLNQKFDVDSSEWFEVYDKKEAIVVNHVVLQELSISYLVPILNQNSVELILVIDFSVKKVENINEILDLMKKGLLLMLAIISIFFIVFIIQILKYKNVKKSSFIDKLTNVHNRNYLHEIEESINLDDYIIAALDIDHFKSINDTYGHNGGDAILKEMGNIMLHTIRVNEDIVIRYGGEEFLILIQCKQNNKQMALTVIERIFKNIKEHKMFISQEEYINITVSIGINMSANESKNFMDAFKLADLALYEAKNSGRDTIKIYDEK